MKLFLPCDVHSNALDQLFYPVLTDISGGSQLPPIDRFSYRSQIKSLQQFLHYNEKLDGPDSGVINMLCKELESWLTVLARFSAFHEKEVHLFNHCKT